jgi:hypothetical protein
VHAGYQPRATAVVGVVLQQQLPRLLVECGLGIRVYQETFDSDQNVLDPVRRLPVLLQGVDTDLARVGDIGVEDLGNESTWYKGFY